MPRPAAPDLSLSPADRTKAADRAGVAPAAVVNYLRGRRMASTTRGRIEQALRELGHGAAVRATVAA